MMRKGLWLALTLGLLMAVATTACGNTQPSNGSGAATATQEAAEGEQGKVIGMAADASMEEANSGTFQHLAYGGTITVLLPDVGEVSANCPEEWCPSLLAGAPAVEWVDEIGGGFVASIDIKLNEGQTAVLVRNDAGEWDVVQLLD